MEGEEAGAVEVETPTDVRLYVDRRCAETVCWMEEMFCRAGAEGRGVRLDVGGKLKGSPLGWEKGIPHVNGR